MNLRRIIFKMTPRWLVQLATDLRCLLRSAVICGPIPYQKATNKPALIVAPHPDDETFSCGGLIRLKRAAGVPVRVIILTDGEAVADGRCERPETVVAARKREALEACRRLGVEADSVRWLHLPDGKLPYPDQAGFEEFARILLAEIAEFAPGEVYCPHWHDGHDDHITSNQLTHHALRQWSRPCAFFYYPVWMWYHASSGLGKRLVTTGAWRLDISAVLADKKQAMRAYLDAPKTAQGNPFCGRLPWSFLKVFRRKYEVYFAASAGGEATTEPRHEDGLATALLKALFVSPAGAAYGSERSMLALLRARQFAAEVVCPGGGALERELSQLEIKVYPLEFGKYSVRQNPLWHVGFYRRFRRILKAGKPDVVVINLDGNTPLVTLAAVRSGIPLIRFSRFEFQPPTRWLDRWCWLKTRAIICPSERVRQQVRDWMPPKFHSRVHRLYDAYAGPAATPREVAAFRQEFHLGDDKLIGCVGRLHRGKRIETAIRALAEVRKQIGNARLLVIGGDGSPDETAYKEELQQLAKELGIGEPVTFTGYRRTEDMPAAIAALDVCVLPSESESFGMVLMEAWAQGVPTVASDVGGCSEITRASGGGCLAPVGDAKAFAGHLLALLANPSAVRALRQKGKDWVSQNSSPARYAARFESIINACKSAAQWNLAAKFKFLASHPDMLAAYVRWVGSKLFSGKTPRLALPGGARIGGWVSFSEYWSFQNVIPKRERLFVERSLAACPERKATAFDIGANVGAFTCMMATKGHLVHSFEPIPETFCRLKENAKFNGQLERVHLNCLAVGKEPGLVTFHVEEFGAATNHLVLPDKSSTRSATSTQLVAVTSLDGYCRQQGIHRIDLVKLDVEGMEAYVLQGAKALLKERRIAAILIEICPVNLRAVGLSPADLYREFASARYSPYKLKEDGQPGAKLSLADIEAISLDNVVLLPDV